MKAKTLIDNRVKCQRISDDCKLSPEFYLIVSEGNYSTAVIIFVNKINYEYSLSVYREIKMKWSNGAS